MKHTARREVIPSRALNMWRFCFPCRLPQNSPTGFRRIWWENRLRGAVSSFLRPKKFYTAIVVGFANLPPQGIDVKEVVVLLDTSPVVRHPQLQLWNWVADYYLAALGDVYKAAVPAGLKIESETHVEINPDFEFADGPAMQLSERDAAILQLIAHEGSLTPAAIESRLKAKGIASAINALIERGVLIVAEKLNERYRPKKVQMVKAAFTPDETDEAFRKVSGARKQEALLLAYIDLSGMMRGKPAEVSRDDLLARAGVLPAILSAVIKKGVLEAYAKEVNRFAFTGERPEIFPVLPMPSRRLSMPFTRPGIPMM